MDSITLKKQEEIEQLIKEIGCSKCNNTGFIYINKPSDEIAYSFKRVPCVCRINAELKYKYLISNIPPVYWSKSAKIENIECREYDFEISQYGNKKNFNKIYNKIIEKLDRFINHGYSLVLSGANGTGKTFMSCNLLKQALSSDYKCYYIYLVDLLNIYYSYIVTKNLDDLKTINLLERVDLLCIDEVGKETTVSNSMLSFFETILKKRLESTKSTILITNLRFNGDSLDEHNSFILRYGESIYDLLKSRYRIFVFNPQNNFRLKTRIKWDI